MRVRATCVILVLLVSIIPSANAGAPKQLDEVGSVFGGVHLNANNSANVTISLSDLPAIVEDYTATWCTNCVTVEDALNDVAGENNMKTYHFHRFINENEDPLGSQEGDDRWIARYEQRLPPTVIFNGTIMQMGSVSSEDGKTLQDDYNQNLARSIDLGIGSTSLGWAVSDGSNPVATWNLVFDNSKYPADSEIMSYLWVVEEVAYFPDGSNGEEYYHKSVRSIIQLGNSTTGSMEVILPDAYDGDDLQVHLIHEVVLPKEDIEVPAEQKEEEETEDEDDSSLPSLGLVAVVAMTMFAAVTVQRKQK